MKKFNKKIIVTILAITFVFGVAGLNVANAATSPTLVGSANYSVLGATPSVTNTGATTTVGEVGISPAASITGFPPGVAAGSNAIHLHLNDASAIAAQADNLAAYGFLDLGTGNTGGDCLKASDGSLGTDAGTQALVGKSLAAGTYCAGAFTLSGTLNLTGSGVWVFKSAATLITSGTANIVGGDACNVWWRVASSATLGTNTSLKGNILALTSVVLNTGANLVGRAFAQTGTVTLDTNAISGCATPAAGLNVIKHVSGGSSASDWVLTVASSDSGSGTGYADGTESGTIYTLETGHQYSVAESGGPSGYTESDSTDCTIADAVAGRNYTCTITNTYHTPSSGSYIQPAAPVFSPFINIISTPVVIAPAPIIPKLPKTGFPPQEKSALWNIIIPVGILITLLSFYATQKKQTI